MKFHEFHRRPAGWLCLALGCALLALANPARAAFEVYNNGAITPSGDSPGISGPLAVSNSFSFSGSTIVMVIDDIGLLCIADSTPTTITWSIGSTAFGTDITGPNTTTPIVSLIGTDGEGDNYFSATIDTGNLFFGPGTYWLTLSSCYSDNPNFNEVFWTQSSGASLAFQQNGTDTPTSIPSEAFTLLGVPEPSTYALAVGGLVLVGLVRRPNFRWARPS